MKPLPSPAQHAVEDKELYDHHCKDKPPFEDTEVGADSKNVSSHVSAIEHEEAKIDSDEVDGSIGKKAKERVGGRSTGLHIL